MIIDFYTQYQTFLKTTIAWKIFPNRLKTLIQHYKPQIIVIHINKIHKPYILLELCIHITHSQLR